MKASRGLDDTSLENRERGAGSTGSKVVKWKNTQTLTGEVTKPLEDPNRLGSS